MMKIFKRNKSEKLSWLNQVYPEFLDKASTADDLGYIVKFDEDDLSEHINAPGSYEIGHMIMNYNKSISEKRAADINSGASLTKEEKVALKKAIIEEEYIKNDRWISFTGYEIISENTSVYVVFSVEPAGGMGGTHAEFFDIFSSKENAVDNLLKENYFYQGSLEPWE